MRFFKNAIMCLFPAGEEMIIVSEWRDQALWNLYILLISLDIYRLDHLKWYFEFPVVVEFHKSSRFLPFLCLVDLPWICNGRVLRRWIWWSRYLISLTSIFSSCLVCHSRMVAFNFILVRSPWISREILRRDGNSPGLVVPFQNRDWLTEVGWGRAPQYYKGESSW